MIHRFKKERKKESSSQILTQKLGFNVGYTHTHFLSVEGNVESL